MTEQRMRKALSKAYHLENYKKHQRQKEKKKNKQKKKKKLKYKENFQKEKQNMVKQYQ